MKFRIPRYLPIAFLFILNLPSAAQETDIIYLSGTGFDNTVAWDFYCTAGMSSGSWTTIEVPSCWEQQGFGKYHYGHDPFDERLKEEGHYRYDFTVPGELKGNTINLVFEGVMTDARVLINGKSAGEVHQGAFYPFSFDVSDKLNYEGSNSLEVFVKKFSDNMSVNQAERKADYWIFGGIFRPVYLEVKPQEHIRRVEVDAKANGHFRTRVILSGIRKANGIMVRILDENDKEVKVINSSLSKGAESVELESNISGIRSWNPESPVLYTAEYTIMDKRNFPIHVFHEKIGFRTVDVRSQDGIYVNGVRVKLKGVNRHTFHPDYGRTSSKAMSIEVVNLIKDMNMNAVRMSHYPPDRHFLEVCDSLGLFVLDELAGWQSPSYDSVVGSSLLREMVERDMNHPSVIMWDNANEGGWNTAYDDLFKELDIQDREVNHPWGVHEKTNTAHYIKYDYFSMDNFAPRKIFFSTEFLHGLYDGGHGAGLEDFWLRMWNHPLCAGGFLWVFADEAVKRSDTGELDTDGNHAPDGILGPYHQKEGSFFTIREIWAPVSIEKRYITPGFNGQFRIQNRFHYTNLDECTFQYQWVDLPSLSGYSSGDESKMLQMGEPTVESLTPGQTGTLTVPLMKNWQEADVLYLKAWDSEGRLIHQWSWPVKSPGSLTAEIAAIEEKTDIAVSVQDEDGDVVVLQSNGIKLTVDKKSGHLIKVLSAEKAIPFSDGPVISKSPLKVEQYTMVKRSDGAVELNFQYENNNSLTWTMYSNGLVEMDLSYQPQDYPIISSGASFSYPESEITGVDYLGNGPYRVWKNRMKGVVFNIHSKEYNNTITGHTIYEYPEFKGYYSNLYWASFNGRSHADFRVYSRTEDLFLGLFTPDEATNPAKTTVDHPAGDISFLLGIPAIGTKFKRPEALGPQSQTYNYQSKRVSGGSLSINLTFDFRN